MPPLDQTTDVDDETETEDIPGDEAEDETLDDTGDPSTADEVARARAQGWVPEDEWDDARAERAGRRRPKSFLTARDFLSQNENSMPYLRAQLRNTTEKLVATGRKVDDMHLVLMDQKRMAADATHRAYQRGRAEAEADMRRAVEEGDVAAFDAAQARLRRMNEAPPAAPEQRQQQAPAAPEAKQPDPETQEWVNQNPWFLKNPTLHTAMINEHNLVLAANPQAGQWDSLEDAAAKVKTRYSEFFKPVRKGTQTVTTPTGNRPARQTGAGKLASIPKADQDAYYRQKAMFKEKGYTFTEEEFLREYNGG